jgi:F0F1-type ATP synthase delta subunit
MASAAPSPEPHALDIGAERIARVYAQAILEAADLKNCRAEVIEELEQFVRDVLPKVPLARAVFDSPRVTVGQKDALIERIAAGRMRPTTIHALHVLARHGRLGIIAEVAAAARRVADEMAGLRQATFTTAVPLSADDQRRIVAEVEQARPVVRRRSRADRRPRRPRRRHCLRPIHRHGPGTARGQPAQEDHQ